jgi:hypothetical protein
MSFQNENKFSDLEDFSYFISHSGSILVASLSGLCESDALTLLTQCKNEIESRCTDAIHGVILNFSGVTGIANELAPFWAQLQSMIRGKQLELRLCGIENTLHEKLMKMGILRDIETTNTLQDALPDIVVAMKKRSQVIKKTT